MANRLEYEVHKAATGEYLYMNQETLYIPSDLSNPISDTGVKNVYNMEMYQTPGWSYKKTGGVLMAVFTPDFKGTVGTKSIITMDSSDYTISFKCAGTPYKLSIAEFFPFVYQQLSAEIIQSYLGLNRGHPLFTSPSNQLSDKMTKLKANQQASAKVKKMFTKNLEVKKTDSYRNIFSLKHLPAFCVNGQEVHLSTRKILEQSIPQSLTISGVDQAFTVKLYTPTDYSSTVLTYEYALGILSRLLVFAELDIVPVLSIGSGLNVMSLHEKIDLYHKQDASDLDDIVENTHTLLSVFENFRPDKTRLLADLKKHDSNLIETFDGENIYSEIRDSGKIQVVRTAKNSRMEEQLVNPAMLSILDSVDVSEKENIGNSVPLTMLAKSNDGVISTALRELSTGETREYPASDLMDFHIVEHNADMTKELIPVRYRGEVHYLPPSEATHQLVSPYASMSFTRSSAVYVENQDLKRTQMTAVALKQSRSIMKPERPLISSGSESIVANNHGPVQAYATVQDVFTKFWKEHGIPEQDLTGEKLTLTQSVSSVKHGLQYVLTNEDGVLTASFTLELEKGGSKAITKKKIHPVNRGYYISSDIIWSIASFHITRTNANDTDVLSFHSGGDHSYWDKGVGTGFTANVMYGFYKSLTVDDASVISDAFVRRMTLHTPRTLITRVPADVYKLGGFVSGRPVPGFMPNGVPKEGVVINPGFPVFYYIKKGKQQKVYLKPNDTGEVFSVQEYTKKDETSVTITLYNMVPLTIGDKFSGRHGNKTLCAKIVSCEHMPYDPETGKAVDIILNPLSIITRMNLGQMAEVYAGLKQTDNTTKIEPPYTNKFMDYIKESFGTEEVYQKRLVDGETGVLSDVAFYTGPLYMLRLVQLAADKIRSVGMAESSDLDNAFKSPVGADPHDRRGQSLGAYEFDLLYSKGCRALLDEIHGVMSTDHEGREDMINRIKENGPGYIPTEQGVSKINDNLYLLSRSIYLTIDTTSDGLIAMSFASDARNREFTQLKTSELIIALNDPKLCEDFSYIELDFKFLNPIAYKKLRLIEVLSFIDYEDYTPFKLTSKDVDTILDGKAWFCKYEQNTGDTLFYYTTKEEFTQSDPALVFETGAEAFIRLLETTPWQVWKDTLFRLFPSPKNAMLQLVESVDKLGGISAIVSKTIPVIPLRFRLIDRGVKETSFVTKGYWNLYTQSTTFSDFNTKHSRFLAMFDSFFLASEKGDDVKSIKEFLFFKEKDGKLRNNVTKKKLFFSMRANILPQLGYHPDEIVLPYQHAVNIFGPFVIAYMHKYNKKFKTWDDYDLVNLVAVLPNSRLRDISRLSEGLIVTKKDVAALICDVTELLEKHCTHYNRAPVLKETGLRGSRVRIHTQGDFININTLLTEETNADFDGDQIPVFAIMTQQGRQECVDNLLPSGNIYRSDNGDISLTINQDALLGLYLLTETQTPEEGIVYVFRDHEDVLQALLDRKIRKNTLVRIHTTVDLACNIIVDGYSWGCCDESDRILTKTAISKLYKKLPKTYSQQDITDILSDMLNLGYKAIHHFNLTLSIKDLQPITTLQDPEEVLLPKFQRLIDLQKLGLLPANITTHTQALIDDYNKNIGCEAFLPKGNNLLPIIKSGAKGDFGRLKSMFGVKGVVESNDGYFDTPIFSGYLRGISQLNSDALSFAQRKNAYATVEGTKVPGALFRTSSFLQYDMVVKPACGASMVQHIFYNPDGSVDPVFLKLVDELDKTSRERVMRAIAAGERIVDVKTPLNDFRPDGGVDEDHQIGFRWDPGTLVGMKSATAMSSTTTQMTISRRHFDSGQGASALNEYISLVESGLMYGRGTQPYSVISIFAPCDGYFTLTHDVDTTTLRIRTEDSVLQLVLDLDYVLQREFPVVEGPVKQGDCLSYIKSEKNSPYAVIHPILSTNFYEGKLRNGKIERILNPNSYQLQFGRLAILQFLSNTCSEMTGGISLSHFAVYASKLFCLGTTMDEKIDYIGKHLESGESFYVSMFSKINLLFYTTGPMTAYLYQKPFQIARLSMISGPKRDASHMSRMMFSVPFAGSDTPEYSLPSPRRSTEAKPDKRVEMERVVIEDESVADSNEEVIEGVEDFFDVFMSSDHFQEPQ